MGLSRPNDLPDMILGEVRNVTFTWSGNSGINSLNSVAMEATPANVTFSAVSLSGLTGTVFITPTQTGLYKITATGVLASGETIILPVRVKVKEADCNDTSSDYD